MESDERGGGYGPRGPRPPETGEKRGATKLLTSVVGIALVLTAVPAGIFALNRHLSTHAQEANQDCVLIVPDRPLSARGLAAPYRLTARDANAGACHEANADQAAFVQGAILDPATGHISIYNPLVVDDGVAPAVAPSVPALPDGAIVALWFGFNGGTLTLRGAHGGLLQAANCVNGLGRSIFGQVAYCNAPQFFQAANRLIRAGRLAVPALGMARDGLPCPTVRDFAVVDQDQSDNVTTTYLTTADGKTAQDTTANAAALAAQGLSVAKNGSDNRLLSVTLDTVLGCTPWKAPDLADGGNLVSAQPLNELQAAMYQASPVATVPSADPMVLNGGRPNLQKLNLYRAGVDQPRVASANQAAADTLAYCRNLYNIAPARLQRDQESFASQPSPTAGVANSLFTFMAQRFVFSFGDQGLDCANRLHVADPVVVQTDENGMTVAATINPVTPIPPAASR